MPRFVSILLAIGVSTGTHQLAADAPNFKKEIQPILKALCFDCHGPEKTKGHLRLDQLNPDLVKGDTAEEWHDVLDQLNLGEMPPSKAPQPNAQQRAALTDWIQGALRDAAAARRFQEGRVQTRRLTRYEYANTMRDLLGVNLDLARDLPPEPPSAEGFLNNGATLEMSPTQIEVYLKAARRALAEAIVTGERPKEFAYTQTETATGRLPNRRVAGHEPVRPEFILDLKQFPRHGEFELKITARAAIPEGGGLPRLRLTMGHVPGIIHVPRGTIGETDVTPASRTYSFRGRMEDFPQPGPIAFGNSGFKGLIVMMDFLDADGNELRYADRTYPQPPPKPPKNKPAPKVEPVPFGKRLDILIEKVEFRSPTYTSWPPPSHQRLLPETNATDELQRVRELLPAFMRAAYRRPATSAEVEQTVKLFGQVRPRVNSFEAALRETYASVLVSPYFLYRVETRSEQPTTSSPRLTDHELATRLSYFLWSTSPDSTLAKLADAGTLHEPAVLRREVARLLADPRATEFTDRFVDQWLDLDALNRVAVNPEFFPNFDNRLKDAMRRETQLYFAAILRENRSALELLRSDWTIANRALAAHYGLEGPRSSAYERVALQSRERPGGLLGHGAFLLANANGEDSHPIKRAVWILDRLLDDPPASPPPDVPELNPENPDLAKLTLKQQLAAHRKKESCANCHRGIDPWGVPLENFDAVGLWRTEVPKHGKRPAVPVDASSTLPNGRVIDGVQELQKYLTTERRDRFAHALVKRVMAYGLGRTPDWGDRDAVEALTKQFIESDFRLNALITAFVQSDAFQTK